MRKIIVILLALVIAVTAAVACTDNPTGTDPSGSPSAPSGETSPDNPEPSQTDAPGQDSTRNTDTASPSESTNSETAPPVYARQIAEGTYKIDVSSSSSMFRIVDAQLTVRDGAMTAVLTMSGKGYGKLYMGTGEQAEKDREDSYIPSVKDESGAVTFTVPVEALNLETNCAAWSIKKEKWYDRVLVFESALIPENALTAASPVDGQYSVEATLTGGSGRAHIESPLKLRVKDGKMTATIIWSSPNYELMVVGGVSYDSIQTEGNATFEIPVALDTDLPFTARTIAMSKPHDIEYVLRLNAATLVPCGDTP